MELYADVSTFDLPQHVIDGGRPDAEEIRSQLAREIEEEGRESQAADVMAAQAEAMWAHDPLARPSFYEEVPVVSKLCADWCNHPRC